MTRIRKYGRIEQSEKADKEHGRELKGRLVKGERGVGWKAFLYC